MCGPFAGVDICLSLAASAVNAAGGERDFGVGLGRYLRLICESLGGEDDSLEGGRCLGVVLGSSGVFCLFSEGVYSGDFPSGEGCGGGFPNGKGRDCRPWVAEDTTSSKPV